MRLPLFQDFSEKQTKKILLNLGYSNLLNPKDYSKDKKLFFVVPQSKRKKWFSNYENKQVLLVGLPVLDSIGTDMNSEFILRSKKGEMVYYSISRKDKSLIELTTKIFEDRDYFVPFGNLFQKS